MADWTRRVFAGSLLGAAAGVLAGLVLARILWSAAPGGTPSPAIVPGQPPIAQPSPLPSATARAEMDRATEQALIVISGLYALDGDLARAHERLATLDLDDPSSSLGGLALRCGSEGRAEVATDLATLAQALGNTRDALVAYIATPTRTPTPPPTDTPSPTPAPTHTLAPSATPPPPPTPSRQAAATQAPAPRATDTALPATVPREEFIDPRVFLLSPPLKIERAAVGAGQLYWKLVRLEWWKAGEGGNCLIYVTLFNQSGQPVWGQEVIVEHGPQDRLTTSPKPGERYGANYRMNSTLNSYIVFVGGDTPSDRAAGLGMGEWLGGMDHTSFVLEFQLTRK